MEEFILNLFIYFEADKATALGIVKHLAEGTEDYKIKFLRDRVATDYRTASRFRIPNHYLLSYSEGEPPSLRFETFASMMHLGQALEMFEEAFLANDAPSNPLYCITQIVDGEPRLDEFHLRNFGEGDLRTRVQGHQIAPSYLDTYLTENGFDFPRLFNDDFFLAIRLTFNNRHYVSSLKLLLCFIDTIAYLESGDVPLNFITFLDRFADLGSIGITSGELWELRNSMLHMTNAESRKVASRAVRGITFYVGMFPAGFPTELDGKKHFSLMDLIKVIAKSVENWLTALNCDKSKNELVFERYDKVYSDVRLSVIKFNDVLS